MPARVRVSYNYVGYMGVILRFCRTQTFAKRGCLIRNPLFRMELRFTLDYGMVFAEKGDFARTREAWQCTEGRCRISRK